MKPIKTVDDLKQAAREFFTAYLRWPVYEMPPEAFLKLVDALADDRVYVEAVEGRGPLGNRGPNGISINQVGFRCQVFPQMMEDPWATMASFEA